ncbi:hypothetical protein BKA70DRAFT_199356 [Coprinopsis sp. MPI-PUGE-AT-0042]|nr:hypothetical protein BKA70DRAFT_199356 [Coprinopsis sp. MPI-PUGE-AT-0042]
MRLLSPLLQFTPAKFVRAAQMSSSIPSEIVLEILGHLSPSTVLDAQTLQSASLSCSHFRSFCQKALFSRIVLSKGKGPSDRLLEAFQTSPILATYVQSLTIKQDWMQPGLKVPEVLEFLLDASAPITEFSCLLDPFVAWQNYAKRTRKSIIALCTLAHLSHLSFSWFPLDSLHFCGLQHLKTFCIWGVLVLDPSLRDASLEDHCHHGPPAQIGELLIAPDQAALDFILRATSGLDLRALKVLTLTGPQYPNPLWEMSTDVAPLLSLCSSSLVEIHFQSGSAYFPPESSRFLPCP